MNEKRSASFKRRHDAQAKSRSKHTGQNAWGSSRKRLREMRLGCNEGIREHDKAVLPHKKVVRPPFGLPLFLTEKKKKRSRLNQGV